VGVRPQMPSYREPDRVFVESLQSMDQHGTVGFFKDIAAHFDLVVASSGHERAALQWEWA